MELTIKQSKLKFHFEYEIYEYYKLIYRAKINRMMIPYFRKIYLYDVNGNEICCLKQESWLKLILSMFPIVNFFKFSVCPYNFYKNSIKKGFLYQWDSFKGKIGGDTYEICEHTGNAISFYRNDEQVGSIDRKRFKEFDEDQYRVMYNGDLNKELVAIFTLLADAEWHTSENKTSSFSWEYTIKFGEKKQDKNWVPKD